VNIAASLMLVGPLGFRGLALATSIAALVHGLTLIALLRRRLHGLGGWQLAATLAKTIVASSIMAIAAAGVERLLSAGSTRGVQEPNAIVQAAWLFAAICVGLAALALAARLLRIREFDQALAVVRERAQKLLGH
jgi:putative peptidoglycan lipid II flippase